eukprot:TRINITY_DN17954_c0_g1_i2.p1 TRINITY_DN17954_c0_g1~~TRINITY_DN17954_c0_g1_i2.p1  ORF type:complete len:104 (+),score=29.14 TRINITY_DN17954_c0_g1_i2:257-568(+)
MYQRGANGMLLLFDLTNPESFAKVPSFYKKMQSNITTTNFASALVGTKCDLIHERKISTLDAQNWATHHGIQYYEVSSSSSINIDEVFAGLASTILEKTIPLK